jgi:hypothetical protein
MINQHNEQAEVAATKKRPAYQLVETACGHAVVRRNGTYAEFIDLENALDCMSKLLSRELNEDDFDWVKNVIEI